MSSRSVGVIGLGAMGMGVARSLLRAGFRTHACDMRPEVLSLFESEGGVPCADAAELGAACEVVVILVVNADQTDAVLFGERGAASTLRPGSVVLASATVLPDYAKRLGQRLAERGILLIDAPVSGGAAKAAEGTMTMMTSGPPEAYAKCEDVLAVIAAKVYRVGDQHGQGAKIKIINQLLAGVHIAAAAEASRLAHPVHQAILQQNAVVPPPPPARPPRPAGVGPPAPAGM